MPRHETQRWPVPHARPHVLLRYHIRMISKRSIASTSLVVLAGLACVAVADRSRTIYFENQCAETIWPGAQGDPLPNNGGWVMAPGSKQSIAIPSNSLAVRFWGRTDCKQQLGVFRCSTGSCEAAAMECRGKEGIPPATLAEFTFGGDGGVDYYDLSLVNGYNLDMKIEPILAQPLTPSQKSNYYYCGAPVARFNVSMCPPELRQVASNGRVSCTSICAAVNNAALRHSGGAVGALLTSIYNNPDTRSLVCCACGEGASECKDPKSKYCCSKFEPAPHGGVCRVEDWPKPSTFAANGLTYDQIFKSQCPDAYSWQFDDVSSTFQCQKANYRITFCPADASIGRSSSTVPSSNVPPGGITLGNIVSRGVPRKSLPLRGGSLSNRDEEYDPSCPCASRKKNSIASTSNRAAQ